jgi:serine/threonine protein kinase
LGSGKYSTVYDGINNSTRKKVILKILKHSNIEKINREILILDRLKNKNSNLLKLIDFGEKKSINSKILVRNICDLAL